MGICIKRSLHCTVLDLAILMSKPKSVRTIDSLDRCMSGSNATDEFGTKLDFLRKAKKQLKKRTKAPPFAEFASPCDVLASTKYLEKSAA